MKDFLLALWQLPQNLLGILWLLINGMFTSCYVINSFDGVFVFKVGFQKGAVSLGRYIFVDEYYKNKTIQHEHGHCIQSRYLGWLYLPIIGLPSIIWACIYKYTNKDYYWFYTEKSADKLANIKR
jgi:hypothetical protein